MNDTYDYGLVISRTDDRAVHTVDIALRIPGGPRQFG